MFTLIDFDISKSGRKSANDGPSFTLITGLLFVTLDLLAATRDTGYGE